MPNILKIQNDILRAVTFFILFMISSSTMLFAAEARNIANGQSKVTVNTFTDNTTGIKFRLVKGGCFQMGNLFDDSANENPVFEGTSDDILVGKIVEKPVHEVCVDDLWMGVYEVTQVEYQKVMGLNPSDFKLCGGNCPVESVSWDETLEFIKKLNTLSGRNYRLPTEAEWEYACRSGGNKEKYCGGNNLEKISWYSTNSFDATHPVGQKAPNGLGLYDMTGNVSEWVQDRLDQDYYKNGPKSGLWKNPPGPAKCSINDWQGDCRILRGGSWSDSPEYLRSSSRISNSPDTKYVSNGFRLVFSGR